MKELLIAAIILATGFTAGEVMLQMLNHSTDEPAPIVHIQKSKKPIYSVICDWPNCYMKETPDANVSTNLERNVR